MGNTDSGLEINSQADSQVAGAEADLKNFIHINENSLDPLSMDTDTDADAASAADAPVPMRKSRRRAADPAKRAAMAEQMMQFAGLGAHAQPFIPHTLDFSVSKAEPPSAFDQSLSVPAGLEGEDLDPTVLAQWNSALAASLLQVNSTQDYLHLQGKQDPAGAEPKSVASAGESADTEDSSDDACIPITEPPLASRGLNGEGWGEHDETRSATSNKRSRSPKSAAMEREAFVQERENNAHQGELDGMLAQLLEQQASGTEIPGDVALALAEAQQQQAKSMQNEFMAYKLMNKKLQDEQQQAREEVSMQKMLIYQMLMQQQLQQRQRQQQQMQQAAMEQQMMQQQSPMQQGEDQMEFSFNEYVPGQKAKRGRPRGPRNNNFFKKM